MRTRKFDRLAAVLAVLVLRYKGLRLWRSDLDDSGDVCRLTDPSLLLFHESLNVVVLYLWSDLCRWTD